MPSRFLFLLSISILCVSDAQISIIVGKGNVANTLSVFIGLLNGTTPEAADLLDNFEGTAFLPVDRSFRQLSRSQPAVYDRVFNNDQFLEHMNQLLRHHMIPGPKRTSVELAGSDWPTLSGESVDLTDVLPLITRGDINSPLAMGHKVDAVLLPSFWTRSVQDIVGADFTVDDDEMLTVYAPPEFDSACPDFLRTHVVAGRVDMEPTDVVVEETVLANNGVVHRVSQPFAYTACPIAELENPEEEGSPPTAGTNTSTEGTESETTQEGSPQTTDTNISTESTQQSKFRELLPLIIGVSVGSCLVLVGACFGCLLSQTVCRKGDHGSSDDSKKTPVTEQNIPDYVYEDPTYKDEDQGIMLDPEIQEPSFLTLPTFINPTDYKPNNNDNNDTY